MEIALGLILLWVALVFLCTKAMDKENSNDKITTYSSYPYQAKKTTPLRQKDPDKKPCPLE